MVVKSWSSESTLIDLTKAYRNQEVITGVIRSVKEMDVPGSSVKGLAPTLVVALPDGVTGYCPGSDFREFKVRSFNRFVGTEDSFVITKLDLDSKLAILSGVIANHKLTKAFWEELIAAEKADKLGVNEYDAVVTGINTAKGVVHCRIQGQDAYMFRSEWSWNSREAIDAQVGETIRVKIMSIEPTAKLVRVSRKMMMTDPMEILTTMKKDDIIAGKVVDVSPLHGIFVEVETGVVLKGTLPRRLEEPDVGDFVTCRVERVEPKNRRGRVIIINYPKGKRKKKELGSFLFED